VAIINSISPTPLTDKNRRTTSSAFLIYYPLSNNELNDDVWCKLICYLNCNVPSGGAFILSRARLKPVPVLLVARHKWVCPLIT